MSYEPTVWKDGDLVTSAKLNKLEQGVASSGASVFMVNATYNENDQSYVLDKTAGEIIEAFQRGLVCINIANQTTSTLLMAAGQTPSQEYAFMSAALPSLRANTLNDYPTSGG